MAVEKKNIILSKTAESLSYASTPRNIGRNYPSRNITSHAESIKRKLDNCFSQSLTQRQVAAIRCKEGTYLEFFGAENYDLAVKSLENRTQGISLLNVHEDSETNTIRATVYIPAGKENYFIKKVQAYATEQTKAGKPKYNDLVSSIEDVKIALLESFWVGKKDSIPISTPAWCEVWLRFSYKADDCNAWKATEDDITNICKEFNIPINDRHLIFPERMVKLICANVEFLKHLISVCPYIAEIRRAPEATSFFEDLSASEQTEWVNELLSRTTYKKDKISVCLLDTGITSGHRLLSPAIVPDHIQSIDDSWGNGDHQGHGTEMAGIALFYDLKQALDSSGQITVPHEIESIKILPPTGGNAPDLYGAITQQAVSLAEISNPTAERVICMAVTAEDNNTLDGSPTSWSAAIDSITSGADEEDEKRLFLISAGNVYPEEFAKIPYPDANILHCVENPGQSWNAITVGAYSNEVFISDSRFSGYYPIAGLGGLSPYSSTSETWSSKWPIKPEVLFDGGNIVSNGSDFMECPDLSLLTTHYRPLIKQFSTIWGTSSATAQAAWFCAKILDEYPDIWPETVRALMIHSANWTPEMKRQFCSEDSKTKGRHKLLRTCGYGIPSLESAIQCMNNSVNMVIQGELQPYEKHSMNEMHLHTLPWPKEVLQSLGETPVKLKVTLSYFIEPGPGEIGWKDKYRYPSCGLRFDVINLDETPDDFKKRINIEMRGDDRSDKGEGTSGSGRWYLGSDNRDVGSIHSDFIESNAVDLCDCNLIAVYPVIGWWRERAYLNRYDRKVRYSLIVSLTTPKTDVDLYTPIITQIQPEITPKAEIAIPTVQKNKQ